MEKNKPTEEDIAVYGRICDKLDTMSKRNLRLVEGFVMLLLSIDERMD